jgi:hypothetical protein
MPKIIIYILSLILIVFFFYGIDMKFSACMLWFKWALREQHSTYFFFFLNTDLYAFLLLNSSENFLSVFKSYSNSIVKKKKQTGNFLRNSIIKMHTNQSLNKKKNKLSFFNNRIAVALAIFEIWGDQKRPMAKIFDF